MGSESGRAHGAWFRTIADVYSMLYGPGRDDAAAGFLHDVFRRHGGVRRVLDAACGTFSIDLGLVDRGYAVVGRDLSEAMVAVGRRDLRRRGLRADLRVGDMRRLGLKPAFDSIVCLGTAFNYLVTPGDIARTIRSFQRLLRPGGLLILDLTNFEAWVDRSPMNAQVQVDYRTRDGTRISIFAFNEQDPRKTVHMARFFTVMQRGSRIDVRFDEAPLKIWRKEAISHELRAGGSDLSNGGEISRSASGTCDGRARASSWSPDALEAHSGS